MIRELARVRRQRGVALIIALILVALATMLAWKVSFDGYLERRRSMGVLAAEQAFEFGLGAEALAADALTQDLQSYEADDARRALGAADACAAPHLRQ